MNERDESSAKFRAGDFGLDDAPFRTTDRS